MLVIPRSEECGLTPEDATGIVSSKNQTNDLSTSCFAPVLLWLYRVLNCRRRWRVARVLLHLAQRLEGGPMRSATSRQMMSQFHGVIVGAHSYGDCFDPAVIPPGIEIGRYVSIAKGVRFFNQNHPVERFSTHPYFYEACPGVAATNDLRPGQLEIGHDVWIGCNAIVTPGCRHIGTGSVIGAGAIVTKDVPDFTIVAGNPARRIRDRFSPELIAELRRIAWWQWPATEVLARRDELAELIRSTDPAF
jgi:virginiamycin A acetyltransferase